MGNFNEIPAGFVEFAPGQYMKPKKSGMTILSAMPTVQIETAQPRIRQSSKPLMNKLESDFFRQYLRPGFDDNIRIIPQGMRVKISGSSWYKVDFYIPAMKKAFEVKGPRVMKNQQSRQMLALKVAANQWPEIEWFLAYKENGQWITEVILP